MATSDMSAPRADKARVDWQPLHEVVYRRLREAILEAEYAPGTTLTVRATAERLGVSPMPVRAAFSRLVAELAVESTASGTVSVPHLSRAKFQELVEMRMLLEGAAAEKAAGCITSSELKQLRTLATHLEDAVRSESSKYLALNRKFKFGVYKAARSPVLNDLIERLWMQIGPFLNYFARDLTAQGATDEYEAIVAALAAGDGPAARKATERDISAGAEFLLDAGEFSTGSAGG
jgi:DNA-binding GntR family transcriptional regulator